MKLEVSPNHRFLRYADGRPFFYLADTAWELFHRCTREEARTYLETRAAQGFTVVQAVMLAEFDGLREPNAYGRLPLRDENPATPDDSAGGYWDHVDWIVRTANELGLVVGALPTWGDKWNRAWGKGPEVFTPENARTYGLWLGRRYRDAGLVWILGGDRPVETETHRAVVEALAAGLREGDGGAHLMTFHPTGGRGSAEWFHEAPWLDFNMRPAGRSPRPALPGALDGSAHGGVLLRRRSAHRPSANLHDPHAGRAHGLGPRARSLPSVNPRPASHTSPAPRITNTTERTNTP